MLATALGGPLAGAAVATIGNALGLGEGATEEQITKALATASPETLLALKKAEMDFQARMLELGFENEAALAKINADDRDSARKREAATGDWTPRILAYMLVGGSIGIGVALLFGNITLLDTTLAGVVIGYLFNEAGAVTSYYFGESRKDYRVDKSK